MDRMDNIDVEIYETKVDKTNFAEFRQVYNDILADSNNHNTVEIVDISNEDNDDTEHFGEATNGVYRSNADIEDKLLEKALEKVSKVLGFIIITLTIALVSYNVAREIKRAKSPDLMVWSETDFAIDGYEVASEIHI